MDILPATIQEQALEIILAWQSKHYIFFFFPTTCLCEKAFSAVVAIRRSKFNVANDLRYALSSVEPRIRNLAKNM